MPFGGCYLVVVTLVFRNKVTAVGVNLGIVAEIQQFQFDSVAVYGHCIGIDVFVIGVNLVA